MPINKTAEPDRSDEGTRTLVTVHPSHLLRLPDAEAKAREYRRFVEDLKIAPLPCCENQHARPEFWQLRGAMSSEIQQENWTIPSTTLN